MKNKRTPLSKKVRKLILFMAAQGEKPDHIAEVVGCNRSTVYRHLALAREERGNPQMRESA